MRDGYFDTDIHTGTRTGTSEHVVDRPEQDRLRAVTPDEGMNAMITAWTLLQARTWSRERIVELLRAQARNRLRHGVVHDRLGLVPAVVEYVKETGDVGLLDEVIPFAEGAPATVYEHLRRALDLTARPVGADGATFEAGGRPGDGDVGGGPALVTFLHAWAIGAFLDVAEALGRGGDVIRFRAQRDRIVSVADAGRYTWPMIAEALLGRGDEQARLEAGLPWLTGTADWRYTALTQYVLGIRPSLEGLVVDPSIPQGWAGFEVRRVWRGAVYEIAVHNPDGVSHGVARLAVDGTEFAPERLVPVAPAGATVRVVVTLG